jgi:D-alanyl-D-alanine endopeptidase (penicillin-binding protein 7)
MVYGTNALAAIPRHELSPRVSSGSAIVVTVPVGQVLFEKDADVVRPIASISKLMSAIVYEEQCSHLKPDNFHKMTTLSRELAKGGDKSRLTTGWSFTYEDILKAALMRSDNRAMPALMEACGMRLQEFVFYMNLKAKQLGMSQTSFAEPNGLSKFNVSTARDVTRLIFESVRHPRLAKIMQTREDVITAYKDARSIMVKIRNTDHLIGRSNIDVIGGKTGYTDIARYCFTVMTRFMDVEPAISMVFLGAEGKETRFGDFGRIQRWLSKVLPGAVAPGIVAGSGVIRPR